MKPASNNSVLHVSAESLLAAMHEPFLVLGCGHGFRVETANPSFCRMFRVSEEETAGRSIFEIAGGEWDVPAFRRFLETGEALSIEFSHNFHAGAKNLVIHRSVCDEGGEKKILLAFEDRTREKAVEKDAEQFVYAASHDLREPVSKIITISEFIEDRVTGLADTEKEYLSRMREAGKNIKRMIEDMTRFWQLSKPSEKKESVDLKKLWEDLLGDSAAELRGARVEVRGTAEVHADRTALKEAFRSLLSNAVKFSREGQAPEIVIENRAASGRAEVTVSDRGVGFDESYADQIFEPFRRLHPKGQYPGTGIGLSIVRRVAENHGGAVHASSRDGQTRFMLSLAV